MKKNIKRIIAGVGASLMIGNMTGCKLDQNKSTSGCSSVHVETYLRGQKKTSFEATKNKVLSELHTQFFKDSQFLQDPYDSDSRIEFLVNNLDVFKTCNNEYLRKYLQKFIRTLEMENNLIFSTHDISKLLQISKNTVDGQDCLLSELEYQTEEYNHALSIYCDSKGDIVSETLTSENLKLVISEQTLLYDCAEKEGMTDCEISRSWSLYSNNLSDVCINICQNSTTSDFEISLGNSEALMLATINENIAKNFIDSMLDAIKKSQNFIEYLHENEISLKNIFGEQYDLYIQIISQSPKIIQLKNVYN